MNFTADEIYSYCSKMDSNPDFPLQLEEEYFSLRESAELLRGARNTIYVYSVILLLGGVFSRVDSKFFVLFFIPIILALFFSKSIKDKYKKIKNIFQKPIIKLSVLGLEEEFKRISLENPNLNIWPEVKRDLYLADYLWAKVQIDSEKNNGRHLGVRGRKTTV